MENNDDLETIYPEYEKEVENYLIIDPQPRWKSWAVWLSTLGAVWTILNAFGLPEKWGIPETTFKTVVDAVGCILIGFGILNNPTDRANF
ncbi:MAG: hypothetical protein IJI07_01200 [Flexilinea sp.]|nr:hypothetical protein [Flexilinea sp.]